MLKENPVIQQKLKSAESYLVSNLHVLIFGTVPKPRENSIRKIMGLEQLAFVGSQQDYDAHRDLVRELLSPRALKDLCLFFEFELATFAKLSENEIINMLLTHLIKLTNSLSCQHQNHNPKTNDRQLQSDTSIRSLKSSESIRSLNSSKNSARNSNISQSKVLQSLFQRQDEIFALEEEIFNANEQVEKLKTNLNQLKEELDCPLVEVEELKSKIQEKEKFIGKRRELLILKKNQLEEKERMYGRLEQASNSQLLPVDLISEEDKLMKYKRTLDWASNTSNFSLEQKPFEEENNVELTEPVRKVRREAVQLEHSEPSTSQSNQIKKLTESINNMLIRQTIGNTLKSFDGSSCLKWPIFLSQYKTMSETCQLSSTEKVLKLESCLTGEAKKLVEILLSTAKEPDEILNILNQKYGRPEIIMKELTSQAFNVPAVKNSESFIHFSTVVRNTAAAIRGEVEKYVNHRSLLSDFISKLPPHLITQWGSYLVEKSIENESLFDFSLWVQQMSEVMSRITVSFDSDLELPSSTRRDFNKSDKQSNVSQPKAQSQPICKACKELHQIDKCPRFLGLSIDDRWKLLKKHNICSCCLRKHFGRCNKRKPCGENNCDRFHHRLLHQNFTRKPLTNEIANCMENLSMHSLLKMVPVQIKGPNGVITIRALLDEGSTTTLLEKTVADQLGLHGPILPLCFQWTNEISRFESDSEIVQAEIASKNSTNFLLLNNVRTVQDLKLPWQKYDWNSIKQKFSYINNVPVDLTNNSKPDILIGQDNAHLIVSRQIIQSDPNGPILSKTKLGWTVHGSIRKSSNSETAIVTLCCHQDFDQKLHETVKAYMTLENFGITPTKYEQNQSIENERALKIAQNSIQLKNGQFEIQLPWTSDHKMISNSKKVAMQRLLCLERKLNKDKELSKSYQAEIDKLLEKNYATRVNIQELETAERVWYLPHFPVLNPNKPGKVRLVFDAAAKTDGKSLNDFLLTGPDMLAPLTGVLIKFRIHRYSFAGDIKEMFNRVNIAYQDTFSQCFLWRDMKTSEPPAIYRMTAMLFGATSSPFMAQFVKNFNAERFKDTYPEACKAIKEHHYVDDWLDGATSEDEAIQLINDVIKVHNQGGFEIRNFVSNSEKILQNIPQHLVATKSNSAEVDKLNEERVLGMTWDSQKDCFRFTLNLHKIPSEILDGSVVPTKRQVLKTAMSVFDPLGFLSPLTIKVRILLQNIWRSGIGWDQQISQQLFNVWKNWLKYLKASMNTEIPRCYAKNLLSVDFLEIHTLSDASEEAYSSVCYLRMVFKSSVEIVLITSKARVAPLKTLTIPKLELLAAVMGVRLCHMVQEQLKLKISKRYFWTDSRTVFKWIQTDKKLQTFVAARVGEILELSNVDEWRWIPGTENIADIGTRSTSKSNLEDSWLTGPKFLYKTEEFWPKDSLKDNQCLPEILLESQEIRQRCVCETVPSIKGTYTWVKLLRITVQVKRFIWIYLKRTPIEHREFLSAEELKWAEKQWWKVVQCSCFPEDLKNIQKKIPNTNGRLRKYLLYMDNDNVLRLSSRLQKMNTSELIVEKVQDPVILDGSHEYTKKMILHIHAKHGHQSTESVLNEIKKSYLIPKARSAVKKIIRDCSHCKRKYLQPIQPQMGLIPEERLFYYKKPFSATGMDYFGPFEVKVGKRIEKRYGVIFTCMTMRAIHIEIAHSLTTDSCILAIRRFLSRRGTVEVILSDNGSNFKGANRELLKAFEELQLETVAEEVANKGITWKFNPPLAPHMGGCWERLICSFKRALEGIMRNRHCSDEVLQTVFTECEYIINNRPLTVVSEHPYDKVSITPNDILIGGSKEVVLAPGVFSKKDMYLKRQWRVSQYLIDLFWKRWLSEYLPMLHNRAKWSHKNTDLKVGDTVFINENNFPRNVWPLGIITKVFPGKDNVIRVVDVRMANGIFRRPSNKIFKYSLDHNSKPGGQC